MSNKEVLGLHYDCIQYPIVTEKSNMLGENNQYTFAVRLDATKPQIKAAVENIFNVNVVSVNTLVKKGKKKLFRRRPGQQSDAKKAIVRIAEGQRIDLAAGA